MQRYIYCAMMRGDLLLLDVRRKLCSEGRDETVKYWNIRIVLLLSTLTIASLSESMPAIAALSEDWSVMLRQPAQNYYSPQGELRMAVPPEVSVAELQQLKLEVDGIDVTAFIERDGDDAVYRPVQPLTWGQHEIRVVEYTLDGEILERGEWAFEVRKSNLFREASLNGDLTLTGKERIDQRNQNNQNNPFSGNGSLKVVASVADETWKAGANADFVYDDVNGNAHNGKRSVDVANFLIGAQSGPLTVQAGEHSISADNILLQNGINNRGVSATLATPVMYSSLTGFTMRSSPVTGFQHGFAINNSDDRIRGLTLQSYPMASQAGTIKVSGVYIDGNGNQAGSAVGGDTTTMGGNGAGGTVDGVFLSNRLRLRGEYASTRFDFDGKAGALAALTDHAYTLLGSFKLLEAVSVAGHATDWTLGVQRRYFGTNFASAADVGSGISDSEVTQIFTQANWGDISLNGEVDQGFDNTSSAIDLPKNRTRLGTVSLGWRPQPDYNDHGIPVVGYFGNPSLTVSATSQQVRTITPGSIAGTGLDTLTNNLIGDAQFTYPTWNWHTNYQVTWLGNHTDSTLSTRTDTVTADGTFAVFDQRLSLVPSIELIREKNKGTLVDTKTIHPSLTANVALLENTLNGNVVADVQRIFTNDGLQDATTWSVYGGLNWSALQANTWRPSLILSLLGSYANTKDRINPLLSSSNYQLFLQASINWNGGI